MTPLVEAVDEAAGQPGRVRRGIVRQMRLAPTQEFVEVMMCRGLARVEVVNELELATQQAPLEARCHAQGEGRGSWQARRCLGAAVRLHHQRHPRPQGGGACAVLAAEVHMPVGLRRRLPASRGREFLWRSGRGQVQPRFPAGRCRHANTFSRDFEFS